MNSAIKILVVEDEKNIRLFLEHLLRREGYQVTAVASGEAALAQIAAGQFNLALLDLKLGGSINGIDVLAALRRQSPDTTVIILTAHASVETAVAALRLGAHDYLFKPCRAAELRQSIRRGLHKKQQEQRRQALLAHLEKDLSDALAGIQAAMGQQFAETAPAAGPERFAQWGKLVVDRFQHIATVDGHKLELSRVEFDILSYLVSQAPHVVSPQEMVRQVQGHETAPVEASDIARSHIYRIRQKIRAVVGDTAVIRTVRGVGYTIYE